MVKLISGPCCCLRASVRCPPWEAAGSMEAAPRPTALQPRQPGVLSLSSQGMPSHLLQAAWVPSYGHILGDLTTHAIL